MSFGPPTASQWCCGSHGSFEESVGIDLLSICQANEVTRFSTPNSAEGDAPWYLQNVCSPFVSPTFKETSEFGGLLNHHCHLLQNGRGVPEPLPWRLAWCFLRPNCGTLWQVLSDRVRLDYMDYVGFGWVWMSKCWNFTMDHIAHFNHLRRRQKQTAWIELGHGRNLISLGCLACICTCKYDCIYFFPFRSMIRMLDMIILNQCISKTQLLTSFNKNLRTLPFKFLNFQKTQKMIQLRSIINSWYIRFIMKKIIATAG